MTQTGVIAVVLAGGFGTRVRHLLPGIPKPMAPVLGRPFVDWILDFLRRQGVGRAVLSVGHLGEVVERHAVTADYGGMRVESVHETTPLGTAGGFLHAAAGVESTAGAAWLVVNGDSLTVTSFEPLWDALRNPAVDGALLAVRVPDAARYGTLEADEKGLLRRFREKQPGAGLVNAGVYLLKAKAVAAAPSQRPLSFESELFPALIAAGLKLRVIGCEADFLDIGTPETLTQAEAFIARNGRWFADAPKGGPAATAGKESP
jgi:D-glycero-alpha-D-manno-heptose 1-phosphate guanylyltransferase